MKHRTIYIVYALKGVFLASVLLVILNFKSSFLKAQHVAYSCDNRIALNTINKLKTTIATLITEQQTPTNIANQIISHFPAVQTIAIAQTMPQTVHIALTARMPLIRINNKKILTTDGMLVDQKDFIENSYVHLPIITMPKNLETERTISHNLLKTITESYALFSTHDVIFQDDTQVRVYDKQNRRFAIVCTAQQLPSQQTIERCNCIRQDLMERGKFKDLSRVWLVDTRFTNQLIVSADHGGKCYGENCV